MSAGCEVEFTGTGYRVKMRSGSWRYRRRVALKDSRCYGDCYGENPLERYGNGAENAARLAL